jgi:hypothetical protein
VAAVAITAVACDEPDFDAAEASRIAEPRLEHFGDFDRWARRALIADPAIRDRAALEESVLAPIRRQDEVQGVWIVREGSRPLAFGHLEEPPDVEFRTVRAERLGEIGVATHKLPDPRTRSADQAEKRATVLLRRTRPGDDGIEVTVTVAYLVE